MSIREPLSKLEGRNARTLARLHARLPFKYFSAIALCVDSISISRNSPRSRVGVQKGRNFAFHRTRSTFCAPFVACSFANLTFSGQTPPPSPSFLQFFLAQFDSCRVSRNDSFKQRSRRPAKKEDLETQSPSTLSRTFSVRRLDGEISKLPHEFHEVFGEIGDDRVCR